MRKKTDLIDVIENFIDDGLLNLEEILSRGDWVNVEEISRYVIYTDGQFGQEPEIIRVILQSSTAYGVTGYRWESFGADDGIFETGEASLDRDAVVDEGERLAEERDEDDAEEIYQQIAETGYFGSAEVNDIEYLCNEATKHSTGYLLITPDWDYPIGTRWTTNGYLQCDHVKLNANYPRPVFAAHALLEAIRKIQIGK